jgi:hypothetical protein
MESAVELGARLVRAGEKIAAKEVGKSERAKAAAGLVEEGTTRKGLEAGVVHPKRSPS